VLPLRARADTTVFTPRLALLLRTAEATPVTSVQDPATEKVRTRGPGLEVCEIFNRAERCWDLGRRLPARGEISCFGTPLNELTPGKAELREVLGLAAFRTW